MMQFHLTTDPNRDAVLHYYNALIRSKISPSSHSYKLLLDAYAVLPPVDIESLERVFNELVADPRTPVAGTHWASMITAHGLYASDPDSAMKVFESISTHPTASVDLQTEPVVWEAILSVAAQKLTVSDLERLHQQMVSTGARATAYVYNVLISGYARAGQIDNARSVFNSMGDSVSGVAAPNNHPQLLTSSGHVKPSTITDTPTMVVYREPSTYEAMIRAELGHGTRENAEAALQMMQARMYPVAVYMNVQNLIADHMVSVVSFSPTVLFPLSILSSVHRFESPDTRDEGHIADDHPGSGRSFVHDGCGQSASTSGGPNEFYQFPSDTECRNDESGIYVATVKEQEGGCKGCKASKSSGNGAVDQ